MSFVEAAIALLEWEDGSSQEKLSLLYSLHPLDFLNIHFQFIYYIEFWFNFKGYLKTHTSEFFNMLNLSFPTQNALNSHLEIAKKSIPF